MPGKIYQLKVSLMGAKPPIWRRILIKADTLLPDLHKILQTTMGWTNSHLHQFTDGKKFYSEPDDDDMMETVDYRKLKTSQLLKKEKDKLMYEYDFGDGWMHEVLLEKILEEEKGKIYPECIAGKRACPPEDCGGVWGYMDLLAIASDPKHEEHEEMEGWLGDNFDPERFNKEEVTEELRSDNFGVFSFFDE